jgi:Domain of unknown function (DUF4249)
MQLSLFYPLFPPALPFNMKYLFLFLPFLYGACNILGDVDLPLPAGKTQIVVICFASPSQATVAFIGRTQASGALEADTSAVEVQSVQIMSSGQQVIGQLWPTATKGLYSSSEALAYHIDSTYFIRVKTVEFGTTDSEYEKPVSLVRIDSVRYAINQSDFGGYHNIIVSYTDPLMENNFYGISTQVYRDDVELQDKTVQRVFIPYSFEDDLQYSGQSANRAWIIQKSEEDENGVRVTVDSANIILFNVSPLLHAYTVSLQAGGVYFFGPLIEPVPTISTIKNGQGVFGFFQTDTIPFKI